MQASVLRLVMTILIGITVQFPLMELKDDIRFVQKSGDEIWLNKGQLLVVPNDNCLQLYDIDKQLRSELILSEDSLPNNYQLYLYDEGIIVMGDESKVLSKKNDHYQVTNISFWSWDGKEVYKPINDDIYNLGDGDYLTRVKPYWINSKQAILNAGLYIFKLDLTNGEVEKIYDASEAEKKYGREAVYWETRNEFCAINDGIFYFLAHNQNTETGVLMKYEDDKCEILFDGRQFVDFAINDDIIVTKELASNGTVARYYYSDKINLKLSEIIEGENLYCRIDNENFAVASYNTNKDPVMVLVLDTKLDKITYYELENMNSENYGPFLPEFMGVNFIEEIPYFVFREQGGDSKFIVCDQNGEVKMVMGTNIRLGNNMTDYPQSGYYIEIMSDNGRSMELQLKQLCINESTERMSGRPMKNISTLSSRCGWVRC